MGIPRDEYHGVGGSYTQDPKTGKRTQVEAPTKPSETGGARDKDGKELNTFHDALEPAFAAPAEDKAAPADEKATPKRSRFFSGSDEATDTSRGS